MSLIGLGTYLLYESFREKRLEKKFESKYKGLYENKDRVWERYKSRYNKPAIQICFERIKNYKTVIDYDYEVIDDIDMDDL